MKSIESRGNQDGSDVGRIADHCNHTIVRRANRRIMNKYDLEGDMNRETIPTLATVTRNAPGAFHNTNADSSGKRITNKNKTILQYSVVTMKYTVWVTMFFTLV